MAGPSRSHPPQTRLTVDGNHAGKIGHNMEHGLCQQNAKIDELHQSYETSQTTLVCWDTNGGTAKLDESYKIQNQRYVHRYVCSDHRLSSQFRRHTSVTIVGLCFGHMFTFLCLEKPDASM